MCSKSGKVLPAICARGFEGNTNRFGCGFGIGLSATECINQRNMSGIFDPLLLRFQVWNLNVDCEYGSIMHVEERWYAC